MSEHELRQRTTLTQALVMLALLFLAAILYALICKH